MTLADFARDHELTPAECKKVRQYLLFLRWMQLMEAFNE